ncbi:hypothetical protein KCU85_g229, partial [Aureobasidium melanogenum]
LFGQDSNRINAVDLVRRSWFTDSIVIIEDDALSLRIWRDSRTQGDYSGRSGLVPGSVRDGCRKILTQVGEIVCNETALQQLERLPGLLRSGRLLVEAPDQISSNFLLVAMVPERVEEWELCGSTRRKLLREALLQIFFQLPDQKGIVVSKDVVVPALAHTLD